MQTDLASLKVMMMMDKKKKKGKWAASQNRSILIMVLASGFLVAVSLTLVIGKQSYVLPDLLYERTVWSAWNTPNDQHPGAVRGYGNGGYLYVHASAYRGGVDTFAVIGLGLKPVHEFGKPGFSCEWVPHNGGPTITTLGKIYRPDDRFSRVYIAVMVNCTFAEPVGTGSEGGTLVVHAWAGENYGANATFVALTEPAGSFNPALYHEPYPYKYKFVYCGSPLYGKLNPARIHEWVTYHAKIFGKESLFVLYDAGGVDDAVRAVLQPWLDSGVVVLHDVREQTRFDGYYYNQFMLLNDCHQRMRLLAPWIFIFDMDEYIYIAHGSDSLETVMRELSGFTQVTFGRSHMSNILCHANSAQNQSKQWGFEKLVYRVNGSFEDHKYAIQPQAAMWVGIHHSKHIVGHSIRANSSIIRLYHYHCTITKIHPCKIFAHPPLDHSYMHKNITYVLDRGMQQLVNSTKQFEMHMLQNSHTHENKTKRLSSAIYL